MNIESAIPCDEYSADDSDDSFAKIDIKKANPIKS
jgi:hypothetical protein